MFPVSTGQEQTRKSAIATFEAIRLIKQNLPGALTHVGLSNCSFGLDAVHAAGAQLGLPALRARIRPRFGDPARGQDHAAGQSIDEKGKELCRRLLFDERVFDARGQLHRRPAANAHRALRRQEDREQEGAVARRHGGRTAAAGDHPGPPRDRSSPTSTRPANAIRRSTSSTGSCSTA